MFRFLDNYHGQIVGGMQTISHVIHGDARGADKMAQAWAIYHGIQPVACAAIWGAGDTYDSRAGLRRNAAMLQLRPDVVIAFPGGRGTAHMCRIAEVAGIPVIQAR